MNVLLDIASLVNRGDWLMFEAMLEQVRIRCPKSLVGVPERVYLLNSGFYGVKGVVPVVNPQGKSEWLRKCLTKLVSFLFRYSRPLYSDEIDLVLFSPGFRFSDQFGVPSMKYIIAERRWFESFRKPGRRLYFMPQAFGPFESGVNKSRVRNLLMLATHVYSREMTSYGYILPLSPNPQAVSVAPDFTCLYRGEDYPLPFDKGNYVVIIPNRQMLVRAPKGIAGKYCEFMFRVMRWLGEQGAKIVLLNHEGVNDVGLMEVLNAAINNTGHVVNGVSGGVCKRVIAGAKLVITSRFHGLVSALAEGTPVLCTSWSHKYQELVNEMGCPHSCLNLQSIDEAMRIVEDSLVMPAKYASSSSSRTAMERKAVVMWDEILPSDTGVQCDGYANHLRKLFYITSHRWDIMMRVFKLPLKLFKRN